MISTYNGQNNNEDMWLSSGNDQKSEQAMNGNKQHKPIKSTYVEWRNYAPTPMGAKWQHRRNRREFDESGAIAFVAIKPLQRESLQRHMQLQQ